jgi:hypothetical protein
MASLPSLMTALLLLSLFHSDKRGDTALHRFFSNASGGAIAALILGDTVIDFILPSLQEYFPEQETLLLAGLAAVPVVFILCCTIGIFAQIPVFMVRALFGEDAYEEDDETEEEIAEGYEEDYDHGARYDTIESDEIPEHYVLVEDPENASGTVNDDVTVIYRYTPPYTVTVCWIDDETGKEFVDCTEEEYGKGDEYTTNPLEENPKDYQLVGTPENANGTVDGDVEVIYRYRKIKNPKTLDGSFGAFVVIAASSVAGFGLYFGLKQRR